MTWQKFTRSRSIEREQPMVTLSKSHFYFNAVATRLLQLKDGRRVIYHIDEDQRKLGFEFVKEDVDFSYSVFAKKRGPGFRCTSQDVVATYPWVRTVAVLTNPADWRFRLRSEGKLGSLVSAQRLNAELVAWIVSKFQLMHRVSTGT